MLMKSNPAVDMLRDKLKQRLATIGVCGMGYVGLPLAVAAAQNGLSVIGFDIDENKIALLEKGCSYIDSVSSKELTRLVSSKRFNASGDFSSLSECDVIVVCVPTPLSRHREPDLSFIVATSQTMAQHLRSGQLVVIESTSYPGTTDEVVKPILEAGGLSSGVDFFLGFSPEREDPGNREFQTGTIPKIVAGDGEVASELICLFYGSFIQKVVPVSTTKTAEAVKLMENIFRAVNIALVNELKIIYTAMGVDIWEVIDAAKTKPFGFMPFYPGPGLGGHCIPIDPFYLTWKSREYDLPTRFIELAGEVNVAMPRYVVERLALELDRRCDMPLSRASVLVVGVSYKKNVPDMRESASLRLMELLKDRGSQVGFHDPLVPVIPSTRKYADLAGMQSVEITESSISDYDVILIATDHDHVDYQLLGKHARLIVDTRNVFGRAGIFNNRIVKA
jgi:UDP-N-acetyl-D-glucosamine dehydrogenase